MKNLLKEYGLKVDDGVESAFSSQTDTQIGLSLEWFGNKKNLMAGFGLKVEPFSRTPSQNKFDPTEETLIEVKKSAGQTYEQNRESEVRRQAMHLGAGFFSLSDKLTFTITLDTDNLQLLNGLHQLESQFHETGNPVKFRKPGYPYVVEVNKQGTLITFALKLEVHRPEAPRHYKFWIY
ncbi:MAG: hypothetical protein KDA84_21195, partial [Planctomycetaceae bacterium]|nr:hypothetical protein [Planctomycetaceae bacterium]